MARSAVRSRPLTRVRAHHLIPDASVPVDFYSRLWCSVCGLPESHPCHDYDPAAVTESDWRGLAVKDR